MSGTQRVNLREFKRVHKEDSNTAAAADNEVRVIAEKGARSHTVVAAEILTKNSSVIISGVGAAVYNAVNVAEIVKHRVEGLHQTTTISSLTVVDKYEAIAEGKPGMEVERKVSCISIELSSKPLDAKHTGYQAPLAKELISDAVVEPATVGARPRRAAAAAKPAAAKKEGDAAATAVSAEDRAERRRLGRERKEAKDAAEGKTKPERSTEKKEGAERRRRKPAADKAEGAVEKKEGGERRRKPAASGDDKPATRGGRAPRGGRSDDKPATRGGRGGERSTESRGRGRGGRGGSDDKPTRGGRGGRGGGDREERPARGSGRGGARTERGAGRGRGTA